MSSYEKIAHCPECDAKVSLKKRPRLGQIVTCRRCGTRLEVIDVMPLEFDWAFEEASFDSDTDAYDYDEIDVMMDDYEDY